MGCTCKTNVFALTTHIGGVLERYDSLMDVIERDGELDKNATTEVNGFTYTVGEIQFRINENREMIKQYTDRYYKCCVDADAKPKLDPFKW